jgi:hypothetical protein
LPALTTRQVKVSTFIVEGCPAEGWPFFIDAILQSITPVMLMYISIPSYKLALKHVSIAYSLPATWDADLHRHDGMGKSRYQKIEN